MTPVPRNKDQQTFEELYQRLEETVAKLEAGGLSLDDALALYEEGMNLARRCQEILDGAELKVTRLKEAFAAYTVPPEPEEPGEEPC
jgi:exodeoxyribonuclease VII small subunit